MAACRIVCSRYGQGKVIIFSPHLEGSLGRGVDPEGLGPFKRLQNAVAFASKGR
jgi:hypothetical protein